MNKIIVCLIFIFIPSMASALTWCQWSGSAAMSCKSTVQPTVFIGGEEVDVSEETLNPLGWYIMNTTHPAIGPDQVQDSIVWSFENNQIGRTWTVRDLTQAEIDQRNATPMTINDYYQWKAIQIISGWTNQQLSDALPSDLVDAYVARSRLENP